jgi:sec-independent protein translocase protein TatA
MMLTALSHSAALGMLNNLFGPDTLIIFLFILIFFGAKKLPELARSMGQAMREFSKAKDDFEREITRPPEQPKQIEPPAPTAVKTEDPHAAPVEAHPPQQPEQPQQPDVTVHPPETVPKQQ